MLLSCGLYGNVIRFLVPLTVSDEVLAAGLDVVIASLRDLSSRSLRTAVNA